MILRRPFGDTRTFSKFNNSDIRRARWQFCVNCGEDVQYESGWPHCLRAWKLTTYNDSIFHPIFSPFQPGLWYFVDAIGSGVSMMPHWPHHLLFDFPVKLVVSGITDDCAHVSINHLAIQGRVGKKRTACTRGIKFLPCFKRGHNNAQYMKLSTKLKPHEKNGCALLSYFE